MSGTDDSAATRVARGLIAGVIAGAVASFAMDRFQAATSSLLPSSGSGSGDDDEPATEKAADAVSRIATGRDVADADKPVAGQAVHYALGIGLGIAYGVAAEFRPPVTAAYGTAFGIGAATLLDEGLVPAVGLGAPAWDTDLAINLYSYASHIVFGGVMEAVRRRVVATFSR